MSGQPPFGEELGRIIQDIRAFVFPRRIRLREFFTDFDRLRSGRCTLTHFGRALDLAGVSLTELQVGVLADHFTESGGLVQKPQNVNYAKLCQIVDEVFGCVDAPQKTTSSPITSHMLPMSFQHNPMEDEDPPNPDSRRGSVFSTDPPPNVDSRRGSGAFCGSPRDVIIPDQLDPPNSRSRRPSVLSPDPPNPGSRRPSVFSPDPPNADSRRGSVFSTDIPNADSRRGSVFSVDHPAAESRRGSVFSVVTDPGDFQPLCLSWPPHDPPLPAPTMPPTVPAVLQVPQYASLPTRPPPQVQKPPAANYSKFHQVIDEARAFPHQDVFNGDFSHKMHSSPSTSQTMSMSYQRTSMEEEDIPYEDSRRNSVLSLVTDPGDFQPSLQWPSWPQCPPLPSAFPPRGPPWSTTPQPVAPVRNGLNLGVLRYRVGGQEGTPQNDVHCAPLHNNITINNNNHNNNNNIQQASRGGGGSRTTVMLRNLPEGFSRNMLVRMLDDGGFIGLYDFVYMPMNFRTKTSFGYAFVNMVSPKVAQYCHDHFQGFRQWGVPTEKVCEVSWSDMHQGLTAHIHRYRNSPVMHESVPDEYKPVMYSRGVRVPFPPPTKKLRVPRIRRSPEGFGDDMDRDM